MTRRYTYATTLAYSTGDIPETDEVEVEVSFTVAWGSPETGRFGPPEGYDPGAGDLVEDIRAERIDGLPVAQWTAESTEYMPGSTVEAIISKLEMDHEDEMLAEAREEEAATHDTAMERGADDRREAF